MTFDAIIIGAGPNGLAMALALASPALPRRLRVALVDARNPRQTPHADTRGSAITRATQAMFATLGLWDSLKPHAQEMREIIVTDNGSKTASAAPAVLNFVTDAGLPAAAAIVENTHLAAALVFHVTQAPDIALRFSEKISGITFGPGLAAVTLVSGLVLKAPLIIGADGRASATRKAAGIGLIEKPYGQAAITFSIAHEHPHKARAEEHFTGDGVLAVLPLPGNASSIVWAMAEKTAKHLMALNEASFLQAFTEKLGSHLGRITLTSQRQNYPLGLMLAKEPIAPRLALIGDAAHVIHPLAGLGLNLGFKDVAALADTLHQAAARGDNPGSMAVLEDYARQRRFDTMATAHGIDAMNTLFANDNPVFKGARDFGLRLVDRMPPAKALLMRQAAGLAGEPPRLMRGLFPG